MEATGRDESQLGRVYCAEKRQGLQQPAAHQERERVGKARDRFSASRGETQQKAVQPTVVSAALGEVSSGSSKVS